MSTSKEYTQNEFEKDFVSILREQPIIYNAKTPKELSYSDFFDNRMVLISVINTGIPYSLFNAIQEYAPLSETDWVEFLDLSSKSLHRYKMAAKAFKPIHSEKILEIAEVTKYGLDVFQSQESFKTWLNTPCFALGNYKPIELIKTSYGKDLVIAELTHIQHGIFV